jgi:hypothetical protein
MRTVIVPLVLLALAPFSSITAQEQPPPLEPGARMRLDVCNPFCTARMVTRFVAVFADTLLLETETQGTPETIPFSSVRKLEVSRGLKSNAGKGAGIGLLVGAGVGAVLGTVVAAARWDRADCARGRCRWPLVGIGALGVGAVGTLIGLTAAGSSDRWEEVPLERLRLRVTQQLDGRFGFGLFVAF